ncbi:MAG: cob(I)yrinic acid a,c-diamide adenosyltransferase [Candidatus Saccharibacteria bacterium]
MVFEDFQQKDSVVVVYTGAGKGKTTAGVGLMARALGTGWKVAFVQFIKLWDSGEHNFIRDITPIYEGKVTFYKGGAGFYNAGELSSDLPREQHIAEARKTYDLAYQAVTSGEYNLVICDEINNAVHEGLLSIGDLKKIILDKNKDTNLCITGRDFPMELIDIVDIATDMTKLKHHFDNKMLANRGIDY